MSIHDLIERVVRGESPKSVLREQMAEVYTGHKPASFWDHYPEHERPFDWSTPAGDYAPPWRVAHKEKLQALLPKMLGHYAQEFPDLVVDYAGEVQGRVSLWVGLRGGPQYKGTEWKERIGNLARHLKAARWPYMLGYRDDLRVVDDLKKNALGEN